MKKILAIIMAAALMLAVFAGCGSKVEETQQPSEDTTPSAEAVADTQPADTGDAVQEPDSEPAETEAVSEEPASMPPMELPLTEELETITCYCTFPNFMGPTASCGVETNDDLLVFQEAEKLLNVKVEWYT